VLYRWQKVIPEKAALAQDLLTLVHGIYVVIVLNLTCIAFLVLDFVETIAVYRSVYFIGTFIPVLIMILGQVIKAPRTARKPRVKKEE
jgi:lysophospholipid acyltransferase